MNRFLDSNPVKKNRFPGLVQTSFKFFSLKEKPKKNGMGYKQSLPQSSKIPRQYDKMQYIKLKKITINPFSK
jgi:hypothetical protein